MEGPGLWLFPGVPSGYFVTSPKLLVSTCLTWEFPGLALLARHEVQNSMTSSLLPSGLLPL